METDRLSTYTDIVWNTDCIEGMRAYPPKCVQLAIADPPYNVGIDYGNSSDCQDGEDYWDWNAEWFHELKRITMEHILIFPGYYNLKGWLLIKEPDELLVWHKPMGLTHNRSGGFITWEPILLYRLCPLAKTHKTLRTVFRCALSLQKEAEGHPTPKPLSLIRDLVKRYSREGDTVLDPFMGSGTTAVAAKQLGRHYAGCEINKDYLKIIKERLTQQPLQSFFL